MSLKYFKIILKALKSLLDIGIFVCVIYLCTLSSKDPFKSHIIGNMSNYFFNISNSIDSIESICVCNNVTLDQECTIENINHGCVNISSNIIEFKPFLLRKLSSRSFCSDMQDSFERNEGKKLSYIFDLKYQTIRHTSIALLIIIISETVLLVIDLIIFFKGIIIYKDSNIKIEEKEKIFGIYPIIVIIISIFGFIAWIAKFVLSLLLYHFIESADIEKYDDFLDCRNVKENFFEKFNDINKLRKSFLAFAIFNIVSESLDKAFEILEGLENGKKKFDEIDSKAPDFLILLYKIIKL